MNTTYTYNQTYIWLIIDSSTWLLIFSGFLFSLSAVGTALADTFWWLNLLISYK